MKSHNYLQSISLWSLSHEGSKSTRIYEETLDQTTVANNHFEQFSPFFWSQKLFCYVCFAVQIRHKHFRQNKPYCFHVTFVINWLLLLLTQIIAGVYNAEIGKCFTIESNFYIIKSTTKIDENFSEKKCSIWILVDKN